MQDEHGAVGALVNNAGYSQSGAVENVPMDEVRRQFETNVFGLVRMCQLVLPAMREQRWGRIVNVSSMGGKLTFPGGGFYHATKYAVEAISDALRFEVRGFGIGVSIIEPGLIRTEFGEAAATRWRADRRGPLRASSTRRSAERRATSTTRAAATSAARPRRWPRRSRGRSLEAPQDPLPRDAVSARLLIGQRALMTDGMWDRFVGTQFPRPGAQ